MKKLSKGKILRATMPLERVFMDFWEPHSKGIGGVSYYLSIVNNATRFSWIYMMDNQWIITMQEIITQWMKH
jgi:hypothetical protein